MTVSGKALREREGTMDRINRHWASLVFPVLMVVMGVIYVAHEPAYHHILYLWGASAKGIPFSDLHAVLTQLSCYASGVNPYYGDVARPECLNFNYSPLLLRFSFLVPGPEHHYAIGIFNLLTFSLLVQFLPLQKQRRDYACMGVAFMSAPVIWLLETSNVDLLVFEVALIASYLFCRGGWARIAAYLLVVISGVIKLYPIALIGHIVRERVAISGLLISLCIVGVLLVLALFHAELITMFQNLPRGSYFKYCWGALLLPLGTYYLATGIDLLETGQSGPMALVPFAATLLLAVWAAVRAFAYARHKVLGDAFSGLGDIRKSLLFSGCLVIVGCFFAWENLPYRQAFFLLLLPALLAMKDATMGRPVPLINRTIIVTLALLWWDGASVVLWELWDFVGVPAQVSLIIQIGLWFVRQVLWWFIISVLTAMLILFVRSSRTLRELRRLLPDSGARQSAQA